MRKRLVGKYDVDKKEWRSSVYEILMTADDTDPWPVEPASAPDNAPRKRMVMVEHADDVWLPSGRYEWVMNPEVYDPKWEVYSRPALAPPHTKATWHPRSDAGPAPTVPAPPKALSWVHRRPELVVAAPSTEAEPWTPAVTLMARADVLKTLKPYGVDEKELRRLEKKEKLLNPVLLNPGSKHKHYDAAKVAAFIATMPKRARRRPK